LLNTVKKYRDNLNTIKTKKVLETVFKTRYWRKETGMDRNDEKTREKM
jgi:hypothetical protein